MEVGGNVIAADYSFLYRDQQVSSFGERTIVGVDDNVRALNRAGIDLTRVRLECADEIQVSAGTQLVAIEQRELRSGAGAKHIGLSDTGLGVHGFHWPINFLRHLRGEFAGLSGMVAADQHTLKTTHQW